MPGGKIDPKEPREEHVLRSLLHFKKKQKNYLGPKNETHIKLLSTWDVLSDLASVRDHSTLWQVLAMQKELLCSRASQSQGQKTEGLAVHKETW